MDDFKKPLRLLKRSNWTSYHKSVHSERTPSICRDNVCWLWLHISFAGGYHSVVFHLSSAGLISIKFSNVPPHPWIRGRNLKAPQDSIQIHRATMQYNYYPCIISRHDLFFLIVWLLAFFKTLSYYQIKLEIDNLLALTYHSQVIIVCTIKWL